MTKKTSVKNAKNPRSLRSQKIELQRHKQKLGEVTQLSWGITNRASNLVEDLDGKGERWKEKVAAEKIEATSVVGDSLLVAAYW